MARDVAGCVEAMRALAPALDVTAGDSLADVAVGIAWTELADPLVARCVEEAAGLFDHAHRLELPLAKGVGAVFMREVADVHRDLFAEHADSYGEGVRRKVARCLEVTDGEYEAALRRRDELRERYAEATAALDAVITPTVANVAPPDDADELEIRERTIQFTLPFNAVGWPALALPCGPAEGGLPASVQIAAPPGRDSLVLALGAALEASLVRGRAA
jgi:Asp-tRNA(Asn)/Glu-tRNA(Gln) amidotransferase A subunit family amidase